MIIDSTTEFADAVSVAHAAGTVVLGNQIDYGLAANGEVDDLYLVITVDTGIITGGSAGTISFSLVSDSTAALATDGSSTVHWTSQAFVTGSSAIAAGSVLACVEVPRGSGVLPTYEQFVGVLYTVGTTTTTAGKVNAFLTLDGGRWKPAVVAAN